MPECDDQTEPLTADAAFMSDSEAAEPILRDIVQNEMEEHPRRCSFPIRGAVALSLVLAAVVGLLVAVATDTKVKKHGEVPQEELSEGVEGLFATQCQSCHPYQECDCGWVRQPGACQNYDADCCWHCCCGHEDRYNDNGNWQYHYPVDQWYSQGFDCNAGFANWQAGWSGEKKQWCCLHAGKGCSYHTSTPTDYYDCAVDGDWQGGWSQSKKTWCCNHGGVACEGSRPVWLFWVLLVAVPVLALCCWYGNKLRKQAALRSYWMAREAYDEQDTGCFGGRGCVPCGGC